MKIVKKKIVTILLIIIGFFLALNFWGVNFKLSKDHQYAVIVFPYDLSIDPFRLVSITVLNLKGEKTSWELPKQRREHFRSCYWGDDGILWIDGEFGIMLTRFENGEWIECPVIGMDEDGILFIDCNGVQRSINQEEIPDVIIRRLE